MNPSPERAGPVAARSPTVLALAIGLGCVVNPLNGTMITMGFPDIAQGFGKSLADTAWLVTLYLASTAALQPVAGTLGDRLGRRGAYLVGLVAFGGASLGAALATTFPALVAFRCLQAVFSAIVIPNGQSLLRDGVAERVRGRAVGTVAAIIGLGAAIGPPLGGWIVGQFGWRGLFWLNLPIVAVALALGLAVLPPSPSARPQLSPVAAIGATFLPLTIGLQLVVSASVALPSAPFFAAAVALLLLAGGLITRSPQGRRDVTRLGTRGYLGSIAMTGLQHLALYSILMVLPAWLQGALGLTPGQVGLFLGVAMGVIILLTPFSGRLVDRWGCRLPAILGFAAMVAGLGVMAWPSAGLSLPRLVMSMALFGAGTGLSQVAVQRQVLDAAPPEATAMAMGLFASSRYLGGIIGAALLTTRLRDSATLDFASGISLVRILLVSGALPGLLVAVLLGAPRRTGEGLAPSASRP